MFSDMDSMKKALIGSGALTALLFWMRFIKSKNRFKLYKMNDGKIIYTFLLIDIIVHIGFSVIGAWLVFMLIDTEFANSLQDYRVTIAVLGGATFREIAPMILDLIIDEVDQMIQKRKRSR